ncbi:hypothetical protein Fot_02871 [Forsythia ovata]|uniref:Uncharacterized protein n=1 Tax=Forsythia ovata TaxID=205694 RepID=A0ABD1X835_9LAMI
MALGRGQVMMKAVLFNEFATDAPTCARVMHLKIQSTNALRFSRFSLVRLDQRTGGHPRSVVQVFELWGWTATSYKKPKASYFQLFHVHYKTQVHSKRSFQLVLKPEIRKCFSAKVTH